MIKLFFLTLILVLIFNLYIKESSLDNVVYKRSISKKFVEQKEEVEMINIIENKNFFPLSFFFITQSIPKNVNIKNGVSLENMSNSNIGTMKISLKSYERKKRIVKFDIEKRGLYLFTDPTFNSSDLIGLTEFNKSCNLSIDEICVMPKSIDLNEELIPNGGYTGDISVKRWILEDPIINIGVREYTGFEPEKNIHWPSSLKTDDLMVKNFDYTSDYNCLVLLNGDSKYGSMDYVKGENPLLEKCISLSKTILEELKLSGIPFGIKSNLRMLEYETRNSKTYNIGYGDKYLKDILIGLSKTDYSINNTFDEIINDISAKKDLSRTVIVISTYISKEVLESLNNLKKSSAKVIIITIDKEPNLNLVSGFELFFLKDSDKF